MRCCLLRAMAICSPLGGWISDRLTKRYGGRIGRCGVAGASIALAAVFRWLGGRSLRMHEWPASFWPEAPELCIFRRALFWSVSSDIAGLSAGSVSGGVNMGSQIGGAVTASLTPLIASISVGECHSSGPRESVPWAL